MKDSFVRLHLPPKNDKKFTKESIRQSPLKVTGQRSITIFFGDRGIGSSSSRSILWSPNESLAFWSVDLSTPHSEHSSSHEWWPDAPRSRVFSLTCLQNKGQCLLETHNHKSQTKLLWVQCPSLLMLKSRHTIQSKTHGLVWAKTHGPRPL